MDPFRFIADLILSGAPGAQAFPLSVAMLFPSLGGNALNTPTQFSKVILSVNSIIFCLKDFPAFASPAVELTTLPFKSPLFPAHSSQEC